MAQKIAETLWRTQKNPADGKGPAAGCKEGKETEREEIVSPHVEDGVRIPGKFEINLDFL